MVILLAMALPCLYARAEALTVSLITCYPGPEVYELCGHSAIRVRGENIDSVWNFGIFDFDQPNFIYRFVKGETDYRSASYPFAWFLPEYRARGSKVVEQDLNLTQDESMKMLEILRKAALPENATYRYNYVKDNCSLRILDKLDEATLETIVYPDSVRYGTFRNEMRAYHEGYPWYQFGIDLALGAGLDYPINSREEMFVPVEMMKNASSARLSDGRNLVKATRVLNDGSESAVLPPTPWYAGPLFWSWIVAAISIAVAVCNVFTRKLFLPYYLVWFFLLGLGGCLIAFLVFVSVHEATDPNALIFWLNPLQFLFVVGMLARRLRPFAILMACYNMAACLLLIVVSPFAAQSFNPAFYPLMLATLSLAASYAIISNNSSYKRR